jgi:hypothetical protein
MAGCSSASARTSAHIRAYTRLLERPEYYGELGYVYRAAIKCRRCHEVVTHPGSLSLWTRADLCHLHHGLGGKGAEQLDLFVDPAASQDLPWFSRNRFGLLRPRPPDGLPVQDASPRKIRGNFNHHAQT